MQIIWFECFEIENRVAKISPGDEHEINITFKTDDEISIFQTYKDLKLLIFEARNENVTLIKLFFL
jgi:hypothetical protein